MGNQSAQILQMGPYPDWDQQPFDAAFTMRGELEADRATCPAMGKLVCDNLIAHFSGMPLVTPVL